MTLPLLYALSTAPADESAAMKDLLKKECLSSGEIATLIDFAIAHGGIDYSFRRMREMQQHADTIIMRYPETKWRECFRDIFDFIISRDN